MILQTDGQRFKGRRGTWYMIDMDYVHGSRYYLYESEIWGDEAAALVVNAEGRVMCETFDGLHTAVEEELEYRCELAEEKRAADYD